MEITPAKKEDLNEMIDLLKLSLGEGLIPKSKDYFIWKHEKNPFGKSKILLAKENGKIVGLRALMRWEWVLSTETIKAVRAVDTATDPAHQGKGIFKKLTLQAIEECKEEGAVLVFNTPNPISLQGYLKMGWHIAGKMPLYLGIGSIVPSRFSEKNLSKVYNNYAAADAFKRLPNDWQLAASVNVIHTPISKDFLVWRYADCPIIQYGAIVEPDQFGIVFRLKKVNRFIELRICELWTENKKAEKLALKAFRTLLKKVRPALVSCAESPLFQTDKKRPLGLFGPFKKGPVTTLKPLTKNKLNNFDKFLQWNPSIGTMELF